METLEKIKVCSICKEEKPYSEYHKASSNKNGIRTACKSCISKRRGFKRQIGSGGKVCPECNIRKAVKYFGWKKHRKGESIVYFDICKECRRKTEELPKGLKRCTNCKLVLGLASYNKSNAHINKLSNKCRDCLLSYNRSRPKDPVKQRNYYLINKYDIDSEEWNWLLDQQGGTCAFENCLETPDSHYKALFTDHDHKCCPNEEKGCRNCVRGILCHFHNSLLGFAKDDVHALIDAAHYLMDPYRPFANTQLSR